MDPSNPTIFLSHSPGTLLQTIFTSFIPLGRKEKPSFGISHLPLSNMLTYLHLFLSYFCFFSSKSNLFFCALEPILCHLLRTLILTIIVPPADVSPQCPHCGIDIQPGLWRHSSVCSMSMLIVQYISVIL